MIFIRTRKDGRQPCLTRGAVRHYRRLPGHASGVPLSHRKINSGALGCVLRPNTGVESESAHRSPVQKTLIKMSSSIMLLYTSMFGVSGSKPPVAATCAFQTSTATTIASDPALMRCAVGYEASVSARKVRALSLGVRPHNGRLEEWYRGGKEGINDGEGIISACRMWNRDGGGTCASDGGIVLLF